MGNLDSGKKFSKAFLFIDSAKGWHIFTLDSKEGIILQISYTFYFRMFLEAKSYLIWDLFAIKKLYNLEPYF